MWPRYSAQHWTGSTRLYHRRVSWPAQEVSEGVIPLQKFGMLPYRSSVGVSYHYRSLGCCHTGVQWGSHAHYRSSVRVSCLLQSSVRVSCLLQEFSEGVMPIYRNPASVSCPLQESSEGVMPITGVQ